MRKPGRYRSYFWARHVDLSDVDPDDLTPRAQLGLAYAVQLAEDAHERSQDPQREHELERLTIEQLADEDDLAASQVARWIRFARQQLFGELSDAAIYKRLQRHRGRRPRRCSEPGCDTIIPITAPTNKQYCDEHSSGKARARRHRAKS